MVKNILLEDLRPIIDKWFKMTVDKMAIWDEIEELSNGN